MGRPKTISDDALLVVARRLFADRGHTVSTREVAEAAGISQAVLFQRFPTKEALFLAAMAPAPPDLAVLLGTGGLPATDADAETHLAGIAGRLLDYLGGSAPAMLHLALHPVLGVDALAHAHAHVGAAALADALAAHLRVLQERGSLSPGSDTRAAAEALIGAVHTVAVHAALARRELRADDHRRVAGMVGVLWRGLIPKTAVISPVVPRRRRLPG